jgi:hypothetical protein
MPPIWLTYVDEKGRILGKGYGIKWSAIGDTFEEHIENLGNIVRSLLRIWATYENMMGTQE